MTQITTDLIKKLREKTHVGLADCRKALEQAEGDLEKAVDILRARGAAVAAKRAGQETTQGIIAAHVAADHHTGALVEIACETDFAANTDAMKEFSEKIAHHLVMHDAPTFDVPTLLSHTSFHNKNLTIQHLLDELVARISENIKIFRCIKFGGDKNTFVHAYIHPGSRLGVLIELRHGGVSDHVKQDLATLAKDICMQIAVTNPLALRSEELDRTVVERERAVFAEQLTLSGKPAAMIDKIIEGKLQKYYSDVCLLQQAFIKDDKVTVQNYLEQHAKRWSTPLHVTRFVRFAIAK